MVRAAKLRKRFRQMPSVILREVLPETKSGAEDIAKMTRILAPKKEHDLVNSTRVEPLGEGGFSFSGGRSTGKLGHKVVYGNESTLVRSRKGGPLIQNAILQEFGTTDQAANPALFPSSRANLTRIKRRITTAVKRGARKA
jgi:hypothetical protein